MKRWKKLTSILLAAVMMLAMTVTICPAETRADSVSVTTVSNMSDHSFAAYQIFSGTYDSSSHTLTGIGWGTGVDSSALLTNLLANTTVVVAKDANGTGNPAADITVASLFTASMSASQVADVLETYLNNTTLINAFVDAAYAAKSGTSTSIAGNSISVTLASGYYLIVDTTSSVSSTTVKAYNNSLLQVVGTEITIAEKTDVPSVEKKVYEESYSTAGTGYVTGYNDVADYDIGDSVAYQLIGEVPNTSNYSYYRYIFTDLLSKGLTVKTDSIVVYAANDKSNMSGWVVIDSSDYTVSTLTIDTDDANYGSNYESGKYVGGTQLTVSFSDIKTANITTQGYTNTVASDYSYIIVVYTATLNSKAVVGLDGNPNEVHLTYSSNPNSVSADDNDDKTENTEPDTVIVFTYELDVTKVSSTSTSTLLDGAQFYLYKLDGTDKYYYNGSTTSNPWNTTANSTSGAAVFTSSNGTFSIKGLDEGTYYLEEITAPTGYDKLSNPIEFTITATTENGQSWTSGTASEALTAVALSIGTNSTASASVLTSSTVGVVSMQIKNTPGTGLPTTGGAGTTLLITLGVIFVVVASVLLITRRRMRR